MSDKQKFLDANFKNVLNYMEHFLFDFAMDGKAIPREEAGKLLQREEDSAIPSGYNRDPADYVSVTLINGIPGMESGRTSGNAVFWVRYADRQSLIIFPSTSGSFKESLGGCLTSLSKKEIRWLFLRQPSDVTVFDATAFDEILESLVDAFAVHKRKEQQRQKSSKRVARQLRAVIVIPGFTPTARVLASIVRHPKPEVRRRLRVATVVACVNPENVFVDGYQVVFTVEENMTAR